mmetsp:Transcript_5276/g.8960  ORF Transcript_5276/g.8960 Transcript_5276/m.8960 type:complete len:172 (-) Transcript_5276:160-675(-)
MTCVTRSSNDKWEDSFQPNQAGKHKRYDEEAYVKILAGLAQVVDDIIDGLVHGSQVEAGLVPMKVRVGRDVRFDVRDDSLAVFIAYVLEDNAKKQVAEMQSRTKNRPNWLENLMEVRWKCPFVDERAAVDSLKFRNSSRLGSTEGIFAMQLLKMCLPIVLLLRNKFGYVVR